MSKQFAEAATYPLSWPDNFPVTKNRKPSRFQTTLFQALENVREELRRFASDSGKKLDQVIISSNYSLTESKPKEPGVAVYFRWDGETTCIPVDRYTKVEDNLQAIYHCIAAERTKLRHGGINLVKAAFRGYAALPAPSRVYWRKVLNYPEGDDLDEVKKKWRELARKYHPDFLGGDPRIMQQINDAYAQAKGELTEESQ